MRIYAENGHTIRRSPEVVEYLLKLLLQEEAVASHITQIQGNLQEWGQEGVHFAGIHRDTQTPVLIKIGVDAHELHWTRHMAQRAPELVPRLFLSGQQLGSEPVGWLVIEAIPYGPLGPLWQGHEFTLLLEAGVTFQAIARQIPDETLPVMTQEAVLRFLRRGWQRHPPGPVAPVVERAAQDYEWVTTVCEMATCHGDLHLCNGLTRDPPPQGPALLIDFQPIRQPWVFDAAYLQVLNSGDKQRIGYMNLVQQMGDYRRRAGLSVCSSEDLDRVATIVLAWFAIRYWAPEFEPIWPDYRDALEHYIAASAAL